MAVLARLAMGWSYSVVLFIPITAFAQPASQLSKSIRALSADVLSQELRKQFQDQTWRKLRSRGDEANRRDLADWRAVETRDDWERLREARLQRLQKALGGLPDDSTELNVRITRTIPGDGFVVENLVYQTRPDFWVSANLYRPAQALQQMPGILIAHSHHRPKTQGELQDMGMTWAREGCLVLVIDQVGHGERADHPFQSERDYHKKDSDYRWWRQDYYYRFDTNAQLHLVGQSLMGWMAWDLMRSVDVLLERPGIARDKIILLGAVAGGGDPAAVTAALDHRISAAVPFNFGGPQPETRYPLPEDAELHFNYLGGAYWEGTRNLRRTGADGFFAWLIVASTAPRPLIYAHEFAWDQEHDPVWKRLNTIYGFYDAADKIDFVAGRGSVKLRPPEATHCTNIGQVHRVRIHQSLKRWFGIDVSATEEYSQRLEPEDLRSMTDQVRRELRPRKLYEILTEVGRTQVNTARAQLANHSPAARRRRLQADWTQLLGDVQPDGAAKVLSQKTESNRDRQLIVEQIALQTEPGIVVPLILLYGDRGPTTARQVVVAVSQAGKEPFLRERADEIAALVEGGFVVCLPDVRGAGTSRGSRGELGSSSYYALLFETPLLGYRLRDLRAVMAYMRTRDDLKASRFALWGDSFTRSNPPDTKFQVPKRVGGRPRFSEPLGGLLALLGALFEADVSAVYVHGGLSGYHDVLTGPYVYIPHDVVVPGVLTQGDLADLAVSLGRPVRLDGLVDGLNRTLPEEEVRSIYRPAIRAYRSTPQSISISADRTNAARWLLGHALLN